MAASSAGDCGRIRKWAVMAIVCPSVVWEWEGGGQAIGRVGAYLSPKTMPSPPRL
jgi:hypothetical protein